MNEVSFTPGATYKIFVSYPPRYCVTNRGKQIEWSKGFTGFVEGEFSHHYSTRKEDYDPSLVMYSGVPVHEEWDYWNNAELNPEIEKFWDWIVVKDARNIPISLPLRFITAVFQKQSWKLLSQRTTDDCEP